MTAPIFRGNDRPTLGVEIELQIVDALSFELRCGISEILAGLPRGLDEWVKPEFMQCYVEIVSGIGRTVADIGADLGGKIAAVERVARGRGLRLAWGATHPFSRWQEQKITPSARYHELNNLLQETVRRPVTFGLHIHVGVESGDCAIGLMNRLQESLPLLLALSANSPFWQGRQTGHHAHRLELLEGFPTGGLPPLMRDWSDYTALVDRLAGFGFIKTSKELWWDLRPNAENGTVEVRICDMPPDLDGVLALVALVQCLVQEQPGSEEPVAEASLHPLLVRQNRWRASRFGRLAELVDLRTGEQVPVPRLAGQVVQRLRGTAEELECVGYLERVLDMAERPTGAERQLAIFEQTGNLREVVRRMLGISEAVEGVPGVPSAMSGWGSLLPNGVGARPGVLPTM